jgi:hypothetical protein
MTCACGAESHLDQIEKFPVDATVKFQAVGIEPKFAGKTGHVAGHCDDGRAIISVQGLFGEGHTFHYPPFVAVLLPEAKIKFDGFNMRDMLQATIDRQAQEIERLQTALSDEMAHNNTLQASLDNLMMMEEMRG